MAVENMLWCRILALEGVSSVLYTKLQEMIENKLGQCYTSILFLH